MILYLSPLKTMFFFSLYNLCCLNCMCVCLYARVLSEINALLFGFKYNCTRYSILHLISRYITPRLLHSTKVHTLFRLAQFRGSTRLLPAFILRDIFDFPVNEKRNEKQRQLHDFGMKDVTASGKLQSFHHFTSYNTKKHKKGKKEEKKIVNSSMVSL